MKKRSEVEIKDTWKLEDMVASDSQWEQLFEEASSRVKQYADYKGRLDESADTLYACLKFDDEISRETELLYVYSRMRSDQDTADQKYQDMFSRAQSLSYRASEHSSYIVPEILAMPKETLDAYMKADNGIIHFKRALEMVLNKREHTLSGEMEELLAQSYDATQGASQIFTMFNNADVKFPVITGENGEAVQITHGNYISLMENQDHVQDGGKYQKIQGRPGIPQGIENSCQHIVHEQERQSQEINPQVQPGLSHYVFRRIKGCQDCPVHGKSQAA